MPDNATLHPAAAKGALCAVNGIMHGSFDADHLYLDDDNKIRDFNIEKLFDDLFLGRPLDAIFIENFRQYAGLLTQTEVPDDVFDNVISMRQWALPHFGRITIGAPRADTLRDHPDLGHCKSRAIFTEPARFNIGSCYAPNPHYAALLCVVTVFRQLAQQFNESRFKPAPGEIN